MRPLSVSGTNAAYRWPMTMVLSALLLAGCRSEPVDAPIAFLGQRDGLWQVWMIERQGAEPKPVSSEQEDVIRLSWFPDGREMLLNLQDGRLVRLNVETGAARKIDFPVQGVADAVIAPDGRRIAYSVSMVDSGDRNDIWTFDLATRKSQKLTNMPGLQHNPVWSVDGKSIYFLSASNPQSHDLWRVDAATGSSEQLTVNALYHFDPAVREDGRIAYSGNSGGDYDLWTLKPGGSPERLTEDAALDAHPSWSPDGKALVLESTREGGVSQLWRIDPKSRQLTRLTNVKGGARMPVWAPSRTTP